MRNLSVVLICGFMIAGCVPATAPVTDPAPVTQSRSGSSFATAVVIKETTEFTGVPAEYAWLKRNRPGWTVVRQALVENGGKPYDILTIQKAGRTEEVYFDISNFFGRV